MASPQIQDGYTPIANDLLEAIIRAGFNQRELVLILTIARATYGWSQKMVKISKLELFRRAGLRPDHGYLTLRSLMDRHVLMETNGGLGIQKDFDIWQSYTRPKSGLVSSRKCPSGAASQPPKSISKSITKTNIADASPASASEGGKKGPKIHPETDPCIHLFSEQFSKKFEERTYQVEWGRDRKLMSGLLKGQGPEVVRELIPLFFRYAPQWVRDNGRYIIPVFRNTFNELQALKSRGDI